MVSEPFEMIKSYIIACCADGKINAEEYIYLKQESEKVHISEDQLKEAIHYTLLNFGKEKKVKKDYKSCVVFIKEALKYNPKNKETLEFLSEAVDELSEDDLLDLARTTINGLEAYKNILFKKIKEKGSSYYSKIESLETNNDKIKDKAAEFLSVAIEIKPDDSDVRENLSHLKGSANKLSEIKSNEPIRFSKEFDNIKFFKEGGMSNIYTATYNDPNSRWHERKIIIKQIKTDKKDDLKYQKLFFKEYNLLRDIDHENIVKIIRKGDDDNGLYYVSEFINGKNLSELIEYNSGLTKKDGKRKRIGDIIAGLLHGMQSIHEESIIHRDIKPANVMITNTANKVKIIDFGLAVSDVYDDKLKEAGTRPYSSPEQRKFAYQVDNRTDIYSFGIILLELITGKNEKEYAERLPASLSNLRRIIVKCTHEEASKRYNYISEIIEEFGKTEVQNELKLCGEQTLQELDTDELQYIIKPIGPEIKITHTAKRKNYLIIAISVLLVAVIAYIIYTFNYFPFIKNRIEITENITFGSAPNETRTLGINFPGKWTYRSDLSWLKIEYNNNEPNKLSLTSLSENTSLENKTGLISIFDENNKLIEEITVKQLGLLPKLAVKPNRITFSDDTSQSIPIEIISNLPWIIESKDNWIKIDRKEGNNTAIVNVSLKNSNLKPEPRESSIQVKSVEKNLSETIVVNQSGKFVLETDKNELQINPIKNESASFQLTSNCDWIITNIPSSLKAEPSSGKAGNHVIKLTITGDLSNQKNIELTLKAKNSDDVEKVILLTTVGNEKWDYNDLIGYLETIKGSDKPIDINTLNKYVESNCEVFYYINGRKFPNSEDITTYVNKIKIGGKVKVVRNTLKYSPNGKIIEFCQE